MPVRNRRVVADAGRGRRIRVVVACVAGWLVTSSQAHAADEMDYLQMLNQEATKVEAPTTAAPADTGAAGTDIAVFEDELKRHYSGTFAFYQKLPRRTQTEIYDEYAQGASIEDIRDQIYDRYLHGK